MQSAGMGGDPPCWAHLFEEKDDGARAAAMGLTERIRVRRVYEPASPDDGTRVLVDRLWPRGLSKERAQVQFWLRDVAPSDGLRRWYGHDPARWPEFVRRYRAELGEPARQAALDELKRLIRSGPVTLLGATREVARSNAEALAEVLREQLSAERTSEC